MKSLTTVFCLALVAPAAFAADQSSTPSASMQTTFADHATRKVTLMRGNDPAKSEATLSIVGPDYFCIKDEPAAASKCYPFSNVYWFENLADHSMVISLRQP